MASRKHRPKDWAPPRSRKGKARRDAAIYGPVRHMMIIKDVWHGPRRIPRWAHDAYSRGWITREKLYSDTIEWEPCKDVLREVLYAESPIFGMMKKAALGSP